MLIKCLNNTVFNNKTGKDLHWYARDKKSSSNVDVAKEEIRLIKEQEEQAMREALGLAPKTAGRSQGNRLDKHEFSELVKRGSTAEDLGAGHAEAARVQGLGFLRLDLPILNGISFLSGCVETRLGMHENLAHHSVIRIELPICRYDHGNLNSPNLNSFCH